MTGCLQVHGRRAAHAGPAWAEVVRRARTVRSEVGELSIRGESCREKRKERNQREAGEEEGGRKKKSSGSWAGLKEIKEKEKTRKRREER